MSFEFDEEEFERDVKIKVVGVGGGGGNAVENMVRNNVEGVDFIIVNTDVAALKAKDGSAMERVQIGRKTTKGRGAGGKPPVAAESAKENSDDIEEALNGASLVFVAAGMGGGTGTGRKAAGLYHRKLLHLHPRNPAGARRAVCGRRQHDRKHR